MITKFQRQHVFANTINSAISDNVTGSSDSEVRLLIYWTSSTSLF